MNDLLTLHFFKGMTNVQKRLFTQESTRSNTLVKAIIFNALKDAKDLENNGRMLVNLLPRKQPFANEKACLF